MREDSGDAGGSARFGSWELRGAVRSADLTAEPDLLDHGLWVVVATFEGKITGWQFRERRQASANAGDTAPQWQGPPAVAWGSSMTEDEYRAAVESVRASIRLGDVYQANICRVLSARLDPSDALGSAGEPCAQALAARLASGNPAPYAGYIHIPTGLTSDDGDPIDPVWVVSASPELYLAIDGRRISSSPIKGTARTAAGLSEKDRAENIMITDLVRNDLQRVCVPGSITVDPLLDVEQHPGLVHLVSTVHGELVDEPADWQAILAATFPPGSISGAPKESALQIIASLETAPRGPYCGAIGLVDAEAGTAELAVGIRTFWWERVGDRGYLRFGTGAGITYESDAAAEWRETELKADRLVGLASREGIDDV